MKTKRTMKRPDKEDFKGGDLMNGPYNQTRYAEHLDKYIDHIEKEKEQLIDTIKVIESICDNENPSHRDIWKVAYDRINKLKEQ